MYSQCQTFIIGKAGYLNNKCQLESSGQFNRQKKLGLLQQTHPERSNEDLTWTQEKFLYFRISVFI